MKERGIKLMKRMILTLVFAVIFGGCAANKPMSPFMREENIFSPQKVAKAGKKADPVTEVLAKLSVFINTDSYSTPQRILLGEIVYKEVLLVLEANKEKTIYSADALHYAKGVALFHLQRYAESYTELSLLTQESTFAENAGIYLRASREFAEVTRVPVGRVESHDDLNILLGSLGEERSIWMKFTENEELEIPVRTAAKEEVERIDRIIFGLIAEYQQPRTEEALGLLASGHIRSKNLLRYKLAASYLMFWKLHYLVAQNSDANSDLIAKTADSLEATLRSVADEDGTPEKLEAKRLLDAFTIIRKTFLADFGR